jgi:ankyrin repeat protein
MKKKTAKLEIGKEEFMSRSNEELQLFKFGVFKDNSLTYMVRTGQVEKVKYLLKRGVDPYVSNQDNQNAIHFAIKSE